MKEKWVLRHCDLDLWPNVTKFNRVWANARGNHLAKTASKSVLPFGWNFVHKKCWTHRHTDTHTHTHTDTQTNWSENITPPRFRGGVKNCTYPFRTRCWELDIGWHGPHQVQADLLSVSCCQLKNTILKTILISLLKD